MRVAVVDDVKEVEVVGLHAEHSTVIPNAIDDAIGRRRRRQVAQSGDARQSPNHGRSNLRRVHDARGWRAQPEHQDLSDEIHTVPPLLGQIRHDGNARTSHWALVHNVESSLPRYTDLAASGDSVMQPPW